MVFQSFAFFLIRYFKFRICTNNSYFPIFTFLVQEKKNIIGVQILGNDTKQK